VIVLLDGENIAEGVCTHGMERYWAVGRLVALGLLRRRDDMGSLEIRDDDSGRTIAVTKKKAGEPAALQEILAHRGANLPVPLEAVAGQLNSLEGAVLLDASGGEIVRTMDADGTVAMEKAIGWAVLRNVPLEKTALLVTAPLTAATVRTALRAGAPLLAGATRPTLQATLAAGGNMHLAGRGREDEIVLYV
jgi:formate dehydrogenase assembly factor FdhD